MSKPQARINTAYIVWTITDKNGRTVISVHQVLNARKNPFMWNVIHVIHKHVVSHNFTQKNAAK